MILTQQQKADLFDLIDANLDVEIDEPDYEYGNGPSAYAFISKDGLQKIVDWIEGLK